MNCGIPLSLRLGMALRIRQDCLLQQASIISSSAVVLLEVCYSDVQINRSGNTGFTRLLYTEDEFFIYTRKVLLPIN